MLSYDFFINDNIGVYSVGEIIESSHYVMTESSNYFSSCNFCYNNFVYFFIFL